ncbi:hypothetical protein PFISCL1PPCAC_5102, partial [Pristionchus fissidentatus]
IVFFSLLVVVLTAPLTKDEVIANPTTVASTPSQEAAEPVIARLFNNNEPNNKLQSTIPTEFTEDRKEVKKRWPYWGHRGGAIIG